MSLSIVKYPQGFINGTVVNTGTYTNASAVVTNNAHGLATAQRIYISANQAWGFWYVTVLTANTFHIREFVGATVYQFIGAGTFTYYVAIDTTGHGWNCVHLPIVFKLASTLWPTNSVDATQTVPSYSNDNGFVKITASNSIGAITELEYVKLTFTGGTTGIYQILTWYSNSIFTINLAYVGGLTFVSVQKYYNNYHARVRIYVGLQVAHYLYAGLNLITEVKSIPDSAGIVTVNIADFLKGSLGILKNDMLQGTKNNTNAFCRFHVTYAEAYDYSTGGYTILDYVGTYADDADPTELYAVNAELPFKNLHSGYLSNYIYGAAATPLKFLTPSLYPVLNAGYLFDISFINQFGANVRVKREVYVNGVIRNLFFDTIEDHGVGVYRYEVAQSIYLEDRIDLTLQYNAAVVSEVKTIKVNSDCSFNAINLAWLNHLGGFDWWTFKTNSEYGVSIEGTKKASKNIFTEWPKSFGESADTILQETSRASRGTIKVRAESITQEQVDDLYRIRTSPLVQIVTSRSDRRTVIVDASSFNYLKQGEKIFDLEFTVALTDNLPSQSL